MQKSIFACLFSVHNIISLSRNGQVFKPGNVLRETSPIIGPDNRKSISCNIAL